MWITLLTKAKVFCLDFCSAHFFYCSGLIVPELFSFSVPLLDIWHVLFEAKWVMVFREGTSFSSSSFFQKAQPIKILTLLISSVYLQTGLCLSPSGTKARVLLSIKEKFSIWSGYLSDKHSNIPKVLGSQEFFFLPFYFCFSYLEGLIAALSYEASWQQAQHNCLKSGSFLCRNLWLSHLRTEHQIMLIP